MKKKENTVYFKNSKGRNSPTDKPAQCNWKWGKGVSDATVELWERIKIMDKSKER